MRKYLERLSLVVSVLCALLIVSAAKRWRILMTTVICDCVVWSSRTGPTGISSIESSNLKRRGMRCTNWLRLRVPASFGSSC